MQNGGAKPLLHPGRDGGVLYSDITFLLQNVME